MPKLLFKDHPATWRTGSDFPSIPLTKISWDTAPDRTVAYVFFGHVNVDFDGSPTAYGPPGIHPLPDDDLHNAWDDAHGWFGVMSLPANSPLVTSGTVLIDKKPELLKHGKYPVIQRAENGDPKPGYYVSTTPHASGPAYMQTSYIDASEISFGALSGRLKELGVSLGDYGIAIRHNVSLQSPFYYADSGGYNHALGECSHKVGKNLGGSGRGNHFNNNYPVSFLVFPESGDQDPRDVASIADDELARHLQPLLVSLSHADNPEDLPLLMGFNETAPPGRPKGTSKLAAFHANPASPQPKNYATILQGLRSFGYTLALSPVGAAAGAGGITGAAHGPVPVSAATIGGRSSGPSGGTP